VGTGPALGRHGWHYAQTISAVVRAASALLFQQFTRPDDGLVKTLGSPVLTPEVQKKLIESVHAEAGSRTIGELEAERDEVLARLIELRKRAGKASSPILRERVFRNLSTDPIKAPKGRPPFGAFSFALSKNSQKREQTTRQERPPRPQAASRMLIASTSD